MVVCDRTTNSLTLISSNAEDTNPLEIGDFPAEAPFDGQSLTSFFHRTENPGIPAALKTADLPFLRLEQMGTEAGLLFIPQAGDSPSSQPDVSTETGALTRLSNLLIDFFLPGKSSLFGADWNRELERRKLEALAEFAAGAGHEINNPLATISGRVQLLLRTETDPEKRLALTTIGGQAYRIRDMIGDAMLFGRPPKPDPQLVDVSTAIENVVEKLSPDFNVRGCSLDIQLDEDCSIWADANQFSIVLSSLLHNSLNAIETDSTVTLTCRPQMCSGIEGVEISVIDSGAGFTPLEREHLFDPFFSGRQAGRGLGFGLSKCWRIVSNHGGRIDVESEPGTKTTFRVWWPATELQQPRDVSSLGEDQTS